MVPAVAVLLVTVAPAQEKPTEPTRGNATRLVRQLELEEHRSAAAKKLVRMGARAVPAIVRGLAHPKLEIVSDLAMILRALGKDARSAIPALRRLARAKDARRAYAAHWALASFHPQGIILVADARANRVVEFDEAGKKVLEITGLQNVFTAERLPNGRYLVLVFGEGVKEVDRKGKVHWDHKTTGSHATRLPGGNTLICDAQENRVVEIDRNGTVVWKVVSRHAFSAQRLANGNTLVAETLGRGVVEFGPDGKVVWQGPEIKVAFSAQRLDNGNTLITNSSAREVSEVDEKNDKIRVLRIEQRPYTARRLIDGSTLVGGKGFLHRYDAAGKKISQFDVSMARDIHHY